MGEAERGGSNSDRRVHVSGQDRSRDDQPTELDLVKLALSNAKQQLKVKDKKMVALKSEVEKAKDLQAKLSEKDTLLDESKKEINNLKKKEARIRELEGEIEKREESETKLYDFMAVQTKQLEQTKIALEEFKLAIANICASDKSSGNRDAAGAAYPRLFSSHELESLRSELRVTRENLCHAQEGERLANLKVRSLLEELNKTKNELKALSEADENGKRAMDDLAAVLQEVAAEANQAKENLNCSRREIETSKSEAAQAKFLMKSMENKYKTQLDQARKEAEEYKNVSGRLRIEVDESNVAWHEKEALFVKCIKRAEEEKESSQAESKRCADALSDAKEKNKKLHEIVKQALDEANESREENSLLKESVAEKERALEILSCEIENLRANDNVKESTSLPYGTEERKNGQALEPGKLSSSIFEPNDVENVVKEEHKEVKHLTDKSTIEKELKSTNISKENEVRDVRKSWKDVDVHDVRNLTERESKDARKSWKDIDVNNTRNSSEKESKDTRKSWKDIDVNNVRNSSEKEYKDVRKSWKDIDVNNVRNSESKDANTSKDHTNNPLDDKTLKDKSPKDTNVSKYKDPKDSKILKDKEPENPKVSKDKDPKTSKDKEPKIPKDSKDAKAIQKEKENNLLMLSRHCSSLDLREVNKVHKEHKPPINSKEAKHAMKNKKDDHRDNHVDDLLKGSIFDVTSPVSHKNTKSTPKHKKSLSLSFADERAISAEDFEHEEARECEMEHEQEHHNPSKSRKKPLFKRFGNMLSRKSFVKRESVE